MTGAFIQPAKLTAGVSNAVQIPAGLTLVGVSVPELTSTSFTIGHCQSEDGTYRTLKDPLGIYGTAGAEITFTIGGTSIGVFSIPPTLAALLNSWIKLTFSASEAAGIELIFKDLA